MSLVLFPKGLMVLKKCTLFSLVLAVLMLHPSCKINYSFTGAQVDNNIKTFSVNRFVIGNAPLAKSNYAQTITESLKDLLLRQTQLVLIETGGDVQISGEIIQYSNQPVAVQSNDVAALNRLTIGLKITLVNKIDATKNFESSFSRFADYNNAQDLNSVEDGLIEEINDQLVQDIFDKAFSNW